MRYARLLHAALAFGMLTELTGLTECPAATPDSTGNSSTPKVVPLNILTTKSGTRFGVFGPKPTKPAPTAFMLASSVDEAKTNRHYVEVGRQLALKGWVYVTIDIPCHGRDQRTGEPGGLDGWAHRLKKGEDLMGPFIKRCSDAIDHLVASGYTDAKRIAVCGTSRGGFCALHMAAADPRVGAVACISPVTNLLALREFSGMTRQQVHATNVAQYVDKLANRAVWISIGNSDERVSTQDCVDFAMRLVAAGRKADGNRTSVPVELLVGPSDGHRAVEGFNELAAQWIQKQVR